MADGTTSGGLVPERLIGERIAGRFVVERLIGAGELSTAFRAHDERLHRRVTVKLFHPRHRDDAHVVESQLAAAKSVARLSHEHIAIVIDRGEHEGMPLVVLEHVRGENLLERIERFAPLAVAEVAAYGLQVARALAYAHGHGVVHGNLRPGNVLLTEEREVKLVDFGGGSYVAQLVGDPYAAPELREVDADTPSEPSDDIYALGALLFVALTEQQPVPGFDPGELQLQRPDMSPRFASVVARALAADPADRYVSMRELAAELAAVRETTAGSEAARSGFGGGVDQPTQAFVLGDALDDTDDDTRGDAGSAGSTALAPRVRTGPPRRARRARAARSERSPSETRARILAWSMVAAPLVALVIFGIMISGERGNEQVKGKAGDSGGPLRAAKVVGVVSFDPQGDDGEEHAAEVANVLDAKPDTTWGTSGYDTGTFNDQKEGVGLVLQLDRPSEVREIAITTKLPGWKLEVRTSSDPSTTLDGWAPVSKITPVENNVRIPVDSDGKTSTHVLLWITELVIDYDDPNRYRARMGEVRILVKGEAASE